MGALAPIPVPDRSVTPQTSQEGPSRALSYYQTLRTPKVTILVFKGFRDLPGALKVSMGAPRGLPPPDPMPDLGVLQPPRPIAGGCRSPDPRGVPPPPRPPKTAARQSQDRPKLIKEIPVTSQDANLFTKPLKRHAREPICDSLGHTGRLVI